MIQVLSVSLGSSARDHTVELALLGRHLRVRRLGCDGDPRRALDLYRQYDGRVDAFGVGGAELDLRVGGRTDPLAYGRRIRRVVRHTPLADPPGRPRDARRTPASSPCWPTWRLWRGTSCNCLVLQ